MGQLPIVVSENKLLRRINVRAYCDKKEAEKVAITIFVMMIMASSKFNLKLWNEYVEDEDSPFSNMYSEVSFTVLYKDEESKENFLNIINNGSFL